MGDRHLEDFAAYLKAQRGRQDPVGEAAAYARAHGVRQLLAAIRYGRGDAALRQAAAAAHDEWTEKGRPRSSTDVHD